MKKQLYITFVLLLSFAHTAFAQLSFEQLGGTFYAYPLPKAVSVPMVLDGYRLVYISHYGRHGSRWMTNDERYEWVLRQFEGDKALTRNGRKAKRLLQEIYANAKGNGGQLTPVGERQHRGIARRMVARFPSIFSGKPRVEARSSVVSRCRKSMQAFVTELEAAAPQASVNAVTDSADMQWMSYESPDEMLLKMEPIAPPHISPHRFLANLFKDPSAVADSVKLFTEMYMLASDMQDVDGLRVSLYPFFTRAELEACYERECLKMWHQNGLDPSSHGIPAQSAASLWRNIAGEADRVLSAGQPAVTLRFGHDTALYRLLSLLGSSALADYGGENLYEIVPMAANLQMAFYKRVSDGSPADSVLVAFWLNESPMRLAGLEPAETKDGQSCLYRWGDVKSHLGHFLETEKWKKRTAGVNTMVGTAFAVTRSVGIYGKGSEEHGQTLPAVLAPHGMTFWTPQTRDTEKKCVAPYYYPDSLLQGFRASHWLVGGCTQDYGSFTIMPEMGQLRLKPAQRASRFTHKEGYEISHPYYYAVYLPDEHLMAEMTASAGTETGGGSRAAIFRFTPDKDGVMHVVINPNSDYHEGFVAVDTARNMVYGYNPVHRIYQGWGERAGFSGWFAIEFKDAIASANHGVKDTVAFVSLKVKAGEPVLVRAATSFTSLEGALLNLRSEMPSWDFLGARLSLDSVWQRQLARIDVEDSDAAKVNEFYGALYRASFLPRVMSDVDGSHPGFSSGKLTKGYGNQKPQTYYGDFSMWDIYRAELPLLTIIEPERVGGMMQSLVTKYEEGGWMPIFPCWNSYTAAMIGDHAAAALADAWVKGIRGFDLRKAYEGVRKNAFESPATLDEYKDGMGRRALKSYLRYGYIPLEDSVMEAFHTKEQVSRTLEYAYDDFCAAQLAKATGNLDDFNELARRSGNWRNVINPKTGWADGRHASRKKNDGWLGNHDLTHRMPFITEGTVMHYSFYVPHDIPGLIQTMGGRDRFIAKLDTLFGFGVEGHGKETLASEGKDGGDNKVQPLNLKAQSFYWHGNEPCHQIAYLYALAGQPWKTQWLVRDIMRTEYLDVPGGLSGNDDAGQISAWYVFSALGFYSVCPGKAEYVIGAPSFRKARIGKLVIESDNISPDNPFIQQTYWNGKPYTSPVITHDMVMRGGELRFVMGNKYVSGK